MRQPETDPGIATAAAAAGQKMGGNRSYGEFPVVHYLIQAKKSKLYLREDPTPDIRFRLKCEELIPEDESFRFRFVAETDGCWRIRSAGKRYLWEYNIDNEVRGTESVADTFSSFAMEPQADWSYRLKVKANNHYLYQDVTTNILTGGNTTDDYSNFIIYPLETTLKCEAYQFPSVCPPDRCVWSIDRCEAALEIHAGAPRASLWAVACVWYVIVAVVREAL
jgi:hypothetical protein